MKAARFGCPDCRIDVFISHVAVTEKHEVLLVGTCQGCKEICQYNLDVTLASLLNTNLVKGSGRVQ